MAHHDSTKRSTTIDRQRECAQHRNQKSVERAVAELAFRRICKEVNGR